MRWGIGRRVFRVEPGLYALGEPGPAAPVLVSANYRMSFDYLRRALAGRAAWILVLDTFGINVWCAAGKGTFGTGELVERLASVGLARRVAHRTLIVPQLAATGIVAREVRQATGFEVVFGPVRADDLPAFLDAGLTATPAMRRVSFTLPDRMILVPVELVQSIPLAAPVLAFLLLAGGLVPGGFSVSALLSRAPASLLAWAGAVLAGAVATPLLLPWIPGRAFAFKGALVGLAWATAAATALSGGRAIFFAGLTLVLVALSSFLALQFTGASVITSLSGVRREMRFALPLQVAAAGGGALLLIVGGLMSRGA